LTAVNIARGLKGARIKDVERKGKMIVIELNNGFFLIVHLKLTGQLIHTKSREEAIKQKYVYAIFTFADQSYLYYNDLRQFGYLKLIPRSRVNSFFQEMKLGPEALSSKMTFSFFDGLLSLRSNKKIKPLLMDQQFIAGIGNIYANEICYCAKVRPDHLVKSLSIVQRRKIYKCLRNILRSAIVERGTTSENYLDAYGRKGDYSRFLKVYGRTGEKCPRCKGKIQHVQLAGRGTFYCPHCQK
jgi:formamidopyrimidine-DNA glycosylase